jgi:hypothetical protein
MRNFILILSFSFFTLSCGNPNTSLIGQIEVSPIVNPNVGILIQNNDLHPYLIDDNKIYGIGNNYTFYTENNFESFQISGGQIPLKTEGEVVKILNNNIFIYTYKTFYGPLNVSFSDDMGLTWQTFMNDSALPGNLYMIGEGKWLFLASFLPDQYYPDFIATFRVYNYDPKTNQSEQISAIENFGFGKMDFIDNENGCLIMSKYQSLYKYDNSYISFTDDGGISWAEPLLISDSKKSKDLFMISQKKALVTDNDQVYIINFEQRKIDLISSQFNSSNLSEVIFLNTEIGYVLSRNSIYKTTNGGHNWEIISILPSSQLNKLQFINEHTGIASGNNSLFITQDGGESWKTLIYPYGYLFGD